MFTRHASKPARRLPRLFGAGLATALIGVGLAGCGAETVEVEFRGVAVETGTQPQTSTTNPADLTSMDWKLGPAIGGEHGKLDTATSEPQPAERHRNIGRPPKIILVSDDGDALAVIPLPHIQVGPFRA